MRSGSNKTRLKPYILQIKRTKIMAQKLMVDVHFTEFLLRFEVFSFDINSV